MTAEQNATAQMVLNTGTVVTPSPSGTSQMTLNAGFPVIPQSRSAVATTVLNTGLPVHMTPLTPVLANLRGAWGTQMATPSLVYPEQANPAQMNLNATE